MARKLKFTTFQPTRHFRGQKIEKNGVKILLRLRKLSIEVVLKNVSVDLPPGIEKTM